MLPSLHDLKYFIGVADSLNISTASKALGVTQPSLSLAIKRLESCFSQQLLIRTKKGVTLTKAGEALRCKAIILMDQWAELHAAVQHRHSEVSGQIRIGAHPSVAISVFPRLFCEMLAKFPRLEMSLVHGWSRVMSEAVIQQKLDCAVVVNPVRHGDLVIQKLYSDQVCLWKGRESNSTQDLSCENGVLVCDPGLVQSKFLLKKINHRKFKFRRQLHSNNLETIGAIVAGGTGVGILPFHVAKNFVHKGLEMVAGSPVYTDEICFIFRKENRQLSAIREISQFLKNIGDDPLHGKS